MHASKSAIHPETPEIVLKSVFQRYDADHDGLLSQFEFCNALEDLGINDETEQQALFALADSNNSKTVHFNDFLNLIKSNDFELILSSREDYEFVIQTFKAFQLYDENGDGQITWNEFYFYLTKHGYSHQYISQYWYYMDTNQTLTVSFEGFWKGFKVQAHAIKQHQLQQHLNKQIITSNNNKKLHSKVLDSPSMFDSHSWSSNDRNKNIFHILKSQLKPTKQNKSEYSLSLGRVLDDNIMAREEEESKSATPIMITTIHTHLKPARPSRLPDIMAMPKSPFHGIIPTLKVRSVGLTINLLSPLAHVRNSNISTKSSFDIDYTCDTHIISESDFHSPHLTPNYSISSPNNYTPYKTYKNKDLIRFPSTGIGNSEDSCDDFVFIDNYRDSLLHKKKSKKQKRLSKKEKRKKKKKKEREKIEKMEKI